MFFGGHEAQDIPVYRARAHSMRRRTTMGQLRERMLNDLKLKGFAPSTQKEYLLRVRHFAAHFKRSPADMGGKEVREYLLYLINVRKISPMNHRMYVAGLKFLYKTTLQRPEAVAEIAWPKVPRKLPDILSGDEVEQLFSAVHSLKHRTILMTAYGAGLRISEACSLEVADLDSTRMLIHVREGKQSKDRYVMLSDRLLAPCAFTGRMHGRADHFFFPDSSRADRLLRTLCATLCTRRSTRPGSPSA
jgi:integrase